MKQHGRKRLGIAIIAWCFIVLGVIGLGEVLIGMIWNPLFGDATRVYLKDRMTPGMWVTFGAFLVGGLGLRRRWGPARIIALVLTGLYAAGGGNVVIMSIREGNPRGIGFGAVCLLLAGWALLYLARRSVRSEFRTRRPARPN